jgi:hypothetical protein
MRTDGIHTAFMTLKRVRGAIHQCYGTTPSSPVERNDEMAGHIISLRAQGVWPRDITSRLNVSRKVVDRILYNESYCHLPRPPFPPLRKKRTKEDIRENRKKQYYEKEKPQRRASTLKFNQALGIRKPLKQKVNIAAWTRAKEVIRLRCEGISPEVIAVKMRLHPTSVYAFLRGAKVSASERPAVYPPIRVRYYDVLTLLENRIQRTLVDAVQCARWQNRQERREWRFEMCQKFGITYFGMQRIEQQIVGHAK